MYKNEIINYYLFLQVVTCVTPCTPPSRPAIPRISQRTKNMLMLKWNVSHMPPSPMQPGPIDQWWIFWSEMLIYAPAHKFAESYFCPVFVAFFLHFFCVSSSHRVKIDTTKPYFSVQGAEQQNFSTFHSKMGKNWRKLQKNTFFFQILFEKELIFAPFSKFQKNSLFMPPNRAGIFTIAMDRE